MITFVVIVSMIAFAIAVGFRAYGLRLKDAADKSGITPARYLQRKILGW